MDKKKGLGRSFKDIFEDNWVFNEDLQFFLCSVEKLHPNPMQPRKIADDENSEDLRELAASIKEKGILQPLVVSRSERGNDTYQIIAGERRWRAAKLAGIKEVPVVVKEVSPSELVEMALIENIQRKDLNCLEEAMAYQKLQDEFGLTQEEIARRVGKSRSAVANALRLLSLPEEIKQDIVVGRLSMGHARALLALDSKDLQMLVRDEIINRSLSVRETEELVRKLAKTDKIRQPEQPAGKTESLPTDLYKREESILRKALGTDVKIKFFRRKGQILIEFRTKDQLRQILSMIAGECDEDSSY